MKKTIHFGISDLMRHLSAAQVTALYVLNIRAPAFHDLFSICRSQCANKQILLLSQQNHVVFLLQGNTFLTYITNLRCVDAEVTSYENWPNSTDVIKGRVIMHTKLVHIECVILVGGVNRQMPGV